MSNKFKAYAAAAKGQSLKPFEFDPGPLGAEQVEIKVSHCGICHSDLSMLDNEWGFTTYPFVPGHEVAGTVVAVGEHAKRVKVGDRVGLGWFSGSCLHCPQCLAGDHNLCPSVEQTMIGRYGGFADRVRCHWIWATPLPSTIETTQAGPLFCGGITVFNPIIQCQVQPTQRVGVIGIGGLGHMALQFLNHWGCEVVAFTSSDAKRADALKFGAHDTVSSRDSAQMQKLAGSLDFILVTANVTLDWGGHPGRAGAQRPAARSRRGAGADSGAGIHAVVRAKGHLGITARQSGHHGKNARVLRPPPHRAGDREIPDVAGQRSPRTSARGQGPLSHRAGK